MRKRQKGSRQGLRRERPAGSRLPRSAKGGDRRSSGRREALAQEIIGFLHREKEPRSMADIMRGIALSRGERKMLAGILADLCRQELLACPRGKKKGAAYFLAAKAGLAEGIVEVHPRGFGFAILADMGDVSRQKGKGPLRQDPFIAPHNLGSAHQGDKALFRLMPQRRGRTEAVVIKVIERAASLLPGIYEAGRETGLVLPEDERFLFNVLVHRKNSCGARNGDAVVVAITDFKDGRRNPEGRIVEVLGDPRDNSVQAAIVVRKHRLPHTFSADALEEAARFPDTLPAQEDRLDLRAIPHVTIDGESARDFDDAVAVEKTKKGWRLHVSIADVSYYVRPGSALDADAYARGTSVYFPNLVVPMLPERLSNNLCSLIPNEPRPAFTAIMDFDRTGRRLAAKFAKSVIVSQQRLTYTIVKKILVDKDRGLAGKYRTILEQLAAMGALAAVLKSRRMERGSIGFSIPEAAVLMDVDGGVSDVIRAERNIAHELIEEFMLAANEAVAFRLAEKNIPTLFRIHEEPDNEKVLEFTAFARSLGLSLPGKDPGPKWFGKVLALVAGTPREYLVSNILLRTMQRARYTPENQGHFGLAASHYTHFTSPIRRYPDLLVHRSLTALLAGKKGQNLSPAPDLVQAGDFLSGRERAAVEAEREMIGRLQVRFMADKTGQTFEGIVSGVSAFGLFVELLDHFVSGAVEIAALQSDYFRFDEKNYRLIGSRSGKTFQLGDLITVRVANVDLRQHRINFVPA